MYRKALLTIFLVLGPLSFGTIALGCSYGASTVCEKYSRAEIIVVGRLLSVKTSDYVQTVVIDVERTFKGRKFKRLVINQPQSTCDPDFSDDTGQKMLLYVARDRATHRYRALTPGINGRVERMSEDLYWLEDLPMSLKRSRLAGTVELYGKDPFEFVRNLAGIKVRVFNENHSFEIVTDKNGVYQLWDIPVGKYQVEPYIPSDLDLNFGMEKGIIDYDTLEKKDPDTRRYLIDMRPKTCGGVDFVVYLKRS